MKKKFLKAFRKTAWKYRHPLLWGIVHFKKTMFFGCSECPICKVIGQYGIWEHRCIPCPMAGEDTKFGCTKFASYDKAKRFRNKRTFSIRADILLRMVMVMEKWPAERFTFEGWKYSGEELPREW